MNDFEKMYEISFTIKTEIGEQIQRFNVDKKEYGRLYNEIFETHHDVIKPKAVFVITAGYKDNYKVLAVYSTERQAIHAVEKQYKDATYHYVDFY